MRSRRTFAAAAALCALCRFLVPANAADTDRDAALVSGPTLGWNASVEDVDSILAAWSPEVADRMVVRLTARWDDVERDPGVYDWSALEPAVDRLASVGAIVTLCLTGSHPRYLPDGGPPSPFVAGSVEGFSDLAVDAVRTFARRVRVFEIWDGPAVYAADGGAAFDSDTYAYLLKAVAVQIRAEARALGIEARVAQGAMEVDRPQWQRALWSRDAAPYVAVLPVRRSAEMAPAEAAVALETIAADSLRHPPAPALWVHVRVGSGLAAAAAAVNTSAAVALVPSSVPGEDRALRARWLVGMQRLLVEGYASAPTETVRFEGETGEPETAAVLAAKFFSDVTYESILVLDTTAVVGRRERVRAVLPDGFVRNARFFDPVTGERFGLSAAAVDGGGRVLTVPVRPYPVVVAFQSAIPAPEGIASPDEDLTVERTRGLTAEEIIARHQQVRELQDDRLDRLLSKARITFHFRVAQGGGTIDVGIASNYFWERGRDLEWEQTDYFINGNRVTWKSMPQLPFIQPEKVITLPLDLTFDKTYAYRLVGEDKVRGRDAYVLAFQPADADAGRSLYRGKVWIGRDNFQMLKTSLTQTAMDAPVLSNEEQDWYRPVVGPDGFEYWLLGDVSGQQVWSVAGRNLVVERELQFDSFEINPPREVFDRARDRAYESTNTMLRDTSEGFRYLERAKDGSRELKEKVSTSQMFAAVGAVKDASTGGVIPLAGFNYFNYDIDGKNLQTNVLFAGVVLAATLSQPDLFGKKIDITGDLFATALKFDDQVYAAGEEVVPLRIRRQGQRATLRMGFPIGAFFKVNAIGRFNWIRYADSDEGQEARGDEYEFLLPADHTRLDAGVQVVFNRRGWNLTTEATWSGRSEWRPWGLVDTATGELLDPGYDESQKTFYRWSARLFKEFFLAKFQKFRIEADHLDGGRLDRFSAYQFSTFGNDRLAGFAGTGVRFGTGDIARLQYQFNILEAVRFSALAEAAWIDDPTSGMDGRSRFGGLGISANFVAPWKTIINLEYGIAVDSAIPELVGGQEFLLFVFKLF